MKTVLPYYPQPSSCFTTAMSFCRSTLVWLKDVFSSTFCKSNHFSSDVAYNLQVARGSIQEVVFPDQVKVIML